MKKWKIIKRCTMEYTTDVEAANHADAIKASKRVEGQSWREGKTPKVKTVAKAYPDAKNVKSKGLFYVTFLYLSEFNSKKPNNKGELMFYVQERLNLRYFNDQMAKMRGMSYEDRHKAQDELLKIYRVNKESVWARDYKDAALKVLKKNPKALFHKNYLNPDFVGNNKIKRNKPL